MASSLEANGISILNFDQKLDITLLDQIVTTFYSGSANDRKVAQDILQQFKTNPDAWMRVDSILQCSQSPETKYFALQILEDVILHKWKVLPKDQQVGIRTFIVDLIMSTAKDCGSNPTYRAFLKKLNLVLVQILKYEWPHNWSTFIQDVVGVSGSSPEMCKNTMVLLRLLSEEVFDFSKNMTTLKAKHLKNSMTDEFRHIFTLCQNVLGCNDVDLINETLQTLLMFLSWIPLGYVFETDLIEVLVKLYLGSDFRNVTLACLTEIANIETDQFDESFIFLLVGSMQCLVVLIPLETDIRKEYNQGNTNIQTFIQNLAMFLTSLLKKKSHLYERKANERNEQARSIREAHQNALTYLVAMSHVDDLEVFKIILEYWNYLATDIYRENPLPTATIFPTRADVAIQRRMQYAPPLSKVRKIMISRMARPEEVIIVENDAGEIVREFAKDTDSIELYKLMRETLVYLTHLDYNETEQVMIQKLHLQITGDEWSWKNLNTLCWAIGSISGAMHEDDEKRFLVTVIRDLLGLCDQKRGKDNKAIVASNIMYVVGQYPRFLRAHWRFLKTVINKLFEFMHEMHEGVQDMACDTFYKISTKCARQFVIQQPGEPTAYVEEIIANIDQIVCDLQPQQVQTFYHAVALMVAAQRSDSDCQGRLILDLMELPNKTWDLIVKNAAEDPACLREVESIRNLTNILRTNIRVCQALGQPFYIQLKRIYLDILNLYKVMSTNINEATERQGVQAAKYPIVKYMRSVKKETLKLIALWVSARQTDAAMVAEHFVPPLLNAVLYDYQSNVPDAREAEVLLSMSDIVRKLESHAKPHINSIFDAVFKCTLDMINSDMEQYPEHRFGFFKLLQSVTNVCFQSLLELNDESFKLILDSIVWAVKHTMRNVSEIGLDVLSTILVKMHSIPEGQGFFKVHYCSILGHILSALTDSSLQYGFSEQCAILSRMIAYIDRNELTFELQPGYAGGNTAFVMNHISDIVVEAFPHLNRSQVEVFVRGLFGFCDVDAQGAQLERFRDHVRDFLVQIREQTGENLDDLYLHEREEEIRVAAEEKRQRNCAVPGILNPYDGTQRHTNGDGDMGVSI